MKEELPRSLVAFEAKLEDAVRRELDADAAPAGRFARRAGRLGRGGRAVNRVVAATGAGLSLAAASAAALLLLGGAASPAYAVTRNTNGTITVKFLRVSGIDAASIHGLNARLEAMGVKAEVLPKTDRVVNLWLHGHTVTCAALQAVTLTPSQIKHAETLAVDHGGRISIPVPQREAVAIAHTLAAHGPHYQVLRHAPGSGPFAGSGSSSAGNSGNSGTGNSGPFTGNNGNSGSGTGNSGSGTGNSGNSGPGTATVPRGEVPAGAALPPAALVHARAVAARCGGMPPSGNSGNSGNSGSGTGNSGNSG